MEPLTILLWGVNVLLGIVCYFLKSEHNDIKEANKFFKLFNLRFKHYLNKNGFAKAKYISIVEFQKRGAVHYHVIYFNLPYIQNIKPILSKLWGHGFIQFKKVKFIRNMSSYLTKYLQKGLMDKRLRGKKAYSCSKGLIKPEISVVGNVDVDNYVAEKYGGAKIEIVKVDDYQAGIFGDINYTLGTLTK